MKNLIFKLHNKDNEIKSNVRQKVCKTSRNGSLRNNRKKW